MVFSVEQLVILAMFWFVIGLIAGVRLSRPSNRF